MIHLFEALALPSPDDHLRGVKGDVTSFLEPAGLGDSIGSCNPQWLPMVLMIVTIQVLVAFRRVPSHFSRPSEEGFVLDFLQNLLYWLSEHGINRLHVALSSLS